MNKTFVVRWEGELPGSSERGHAGVVYGRDVWGWPVGVTVHSFDGPADAPAWRKRLEVK